MSNIKSKSESKRLLPQCTNASSADYGLDLPDGHPDALRVSESRNRRTGKTSFSLCAPWLLCNVFSLPAKR